MTNEKKDLRRGRNVGRGRKTGWRERQDGERQG